jgi:hypothetical protein
MEKREIEELARALAHHNRRRWQTMPARANPASDANGGREAWLRCAKIILEAVDTAMAAPPDGLGAHDRASVPATSVSESRQTPCERRQRVVRIIAKAAHPPISVR